jgi:hypothetical protein
MCENEASFSITTKILSRQFTPPNMCRFCTLALNHQKIPVAPWWNQLRTSALKRGWIAALAVGCASVMELSMSQTPAGHEENGRVLQTRVKV